VALSTNDCADAGAPQPLVVTFTSSVPVKGLAPAGLRVSTATVVDAKDGNTVSIVLDKALNIPLIALSPVGTSTSGAMRQDDPLGAFISKITSEGDRVCLK